MTCHAVMPNSVLSYAMDQLAREVVTIPRKFYDQLNDNPLLKQAFERVSGARIETFTRENQRHRNAVDANGFTNSHESQLPPLQSHQPGRQQQRKIRREHLLCLTGSQRQVEFARDEIAKCLHIANSGDRATLKMDVSFADHSFIIGRGGKNIQTVMRTTGTHIHFPDSNRNNQVEKSNQVSVAGAPDQVLEASKKIRDMLPVSFVFLVDKKDYVRVTEQFDGNERKIAEKLKKDFEKLQNDHSMTINWLPVLNTCAMVTVRGRRSNIERIRDGLVKLMNLLRPGKPRAPVYLGIEVSPHYLSYVLGPNDIKIRYLQMLTDTEFQVVAVRGNEKAYQIPTIRIYGQIDNVYKAWVSLMSLLPAALLIDISEVPQSWHDAVLDEVKTKNERDSGDPAEPRLIEQFRATCGPSVVLAELEELGAVSMDSLEVALNAAKEHDNYDNVVTAMRTAARVVSKINEMLYGYDISLLLRFTRDLRQWKIVARGPEGYVTLLMDVYRALSNPDLNPLAFVREALSRAAPPIRYADAINSPAIRQSRNASAGPMAAQTPHPIATPASVNSAAGTMRASNQQHQYAATLHNLYGSPGTVARQTSVEWTPTTMGDKRSPFRAGTTGMYGGYEVCDSTSSLALKPAPPTSRLSSSPVDYSSSFEDSGAFATSLMSPCSPDEVGRNDLGGLSSIDSLESLGYFGSHDSVEDANSVFRALSSSPSWNLPDLWAAPTEPTGTTPGPTPSSQWREAGELLKTYPSPGSSPSRSSPMKSLVGQESPSWPNKGSTSFLQSLLRRPIPADFPPERGTTVWDLQSTPPCAAQTLDDCRDHTDSGYFEVLQPDEQGQLSKAGEAVVRDDWKKNIANLAPGAGRRIV